MTPQLHEALQEYIAVVSVGPSALRGRPKGTVKRVREFLADLDLSRFSRRSTAGFQRQLDAATKELRREFPPGSRDWGAARKVLNIFLHNAFYNTVLSERHRLHVAEQFFEIPLDSAVARGLRKHAGRGRLPQWPGLHRLTPSQNREYQAFAESLARDLAIPRVYLDALLWIQER